MSKFIIYSSHNMILGYNVVDVGKTEFDSLGIEISAYRRLQNRLVHSYESTGILLMNENNDSNYSSKIKLRNYASRFSDYVATVELICFDKTKYMYFNAIKAMAYFIRESNFAIDLINTRAYGVRVPTEIITKKQLNDFIRNNIALYTACTRGLFNVGETQELIDCLSDSSKIFSITEDNMNMLNKKFNVMIDNMITV